MTPVEIFAWCQMSAEQWLTQFSERRAFIRVKRMPAFDGANYALFGGGMKKPPVTWRLAYGMKKNPRAIFLAAGYIFTSG